MCLFLGVKTKTLSQSFRQDVKMYLNGNTQVTQTAKKTFNKCCCFWFITCG